MTNLCYPTAPRAPSGHHGEPIGSESRGTLRGRALRSLNASLALAAVLAFGAILVPGALLAPGASSLHAQEPGIPTLQVDVNGISTRYHAAGLGTRAPGQPVVVFQSGGGGDLFAWTEVLSGLEGRAAVVAYDRPGLGETSPAEGPLTLALFSEHLHDLLEVLEIPPPYILVGHSWGAPLILDYAERYPDQVAGSIYVDPFQFLRPTREEQKELVMRAARVSGAEADSLWREMEAREEQAPSTPPPGLPPGVVAEFRLLSEYGEALTGASIPPPAHPVTVLLALLPTPRGGLPEWLDPMEWFRVEREYTRGRFEDWLRGNAKAEVRGVPDSSHGVPTEAPHAIVEAIDEMMQPVSGETRRQGPGGPPG